MIFQTIGDDGLHHPALHHGIDALRRGEGRHPVGPATVRPVGNVAAAVAESHAAHADGGHGESA